MTWNVRHAALVWAALAASGAASLTGCGQSNCTEKATCPDTSQDGGDAGSLDATTEGDALVGVDAQIDSASDGAVSDVAVTDAEGGDNECGTLGLACCTDAGCGGGLTCGDGGACGCPTGSKLCDAHVHPLNELLHERRLHGRRDVPNRHVRVPDGPDSVQRDVQDQLGMLHQQRLRDRRSVQRRDVRLPDRLPAVRHLVHPLVELLHER